MTTPNNLDGNGRYGVSNTFFVRWESLEEAKQRKILDAQDPDKVKKVFENCLSLCFLSQFPVGTKHLHWPKRHYNRKWGHWMGLLGVEKAVVTVSKRSLDSDHEDDMAPVKVCFHSKYGRTQTFHMPRLALLTIRNSGYYRETK